MIEMTTNGGNSGILQAMRAKKQKLDRREGGGREEQGEGGAEGLLKARVKPLCSLMAYFPSL